MSSLRVLRLIALLEGISLVLLVFVAVPLKRVADRPELVQIIGPIHGILFLLFVVKTLSFAVERNWKFKEITWKVLLACIIPFGPFYVDYQILRKIDQ
ncbi:MAG: DUF3817 domain-containing protein [Bacteroidota bacterium]